MSDFGTIIDSQTIRFERLLRGPIERVWDYLTKPDCLATWLAAGEIELRVGGEVELRFDVQEVPAREKAGAIIRGVVTRCEPRRGEDVLLVLTHRHLPAALKPNFGAGWHTHLGILVARLRGEAPEPFLAVYQRVLPLYAQEAAKPE